MVDTVKILGALLGNGGMSSGSGASILKSVLGVATGGSQSKAGLGNLLSSVLGGTQSSTNNQAGGSLGDLLGGVLGGGASTGTRSSSGSLSLASLIPAALSQFEYSEQAAKDHVQPRNFEEHSPGMVHSEACGQATLMIRAMVNAAKADGRMDEQEQERILGRVGHVTQDETDFLRNEMSEPLDVEGFVKSIPSGMGDQIYAMSLMAIDLDTNPEAQYLHQLARGLNISPEQCNHIHKQLGAPALYP